MHEVFAHVPYPHLSLNLDYLITGRINPEVFFSGDALDALVPEQLSAEADALSSNGLSCTIHAPFMDLNPGSTARLIREVTMQSFREVLQAAAILKPKVIVFHPGYDRWRYGDNQTGWLKHSIDTWRAVLEASEGIGCTIAVENIFEEEPSTLLALIQAVDSPRFRHCFDVGHWNLFRKVEMEEWFYALGSYIAETHIHDNFGERDDHAPIGEGNIDFALFFRLMEQYAPNAAFTVEAHSKEKLERALVSLSRHMQQP